MWHSLLNGTLILVAVELFVNTASWQIPESSTYIFRGVGRDWGLPRDRSILDTNGNGRATITLGWQEVIS